MELLFVELPPFPLANLLSIVAYCWFLWLLTQTFNHAKANPGILCSFAVEAIFILEPCFWLNWKTHEINTLFPC
jgi:hypothetical protein